jgi:CPA2 family monovalent cation:H+ antiporter-2
MPVAETFFTEILIIFALSIAVLALCYRAKMPGIVAFFLVGVLAGPYGLGFVSDTADVEVLAEIGIIILLFTIGMEISLKSLLEMKRGLLIGGVLQIGLTIIVVALIAMAAGLPAPVAIFFGMLLSHTSTAVMLSIFQHRGEVDTPPVRLSLGISVLQDLSTVPMILIVPVLAGMDAAGILPSLATFGLGLALVVAVVLAALKVVPPLLYRVTCLRSRELFVLTIVTICLGTAWITSQAGLSLALGAFLAGLIISESEYSREALSSIIPFKDVFTSFFFISMGMLLDTAFFAAHAPLILVLILAAIIGKAIIGAVAVLPAGASLGTAIVTGLAIGQIGEFAFVLSWSGVEYGLLAPGPEQVFLAVAIGTMAVSPWVVGAAPAVSAAVRRLPLPPCLRAGEAPPAPPEQRYKDHIVIVGFGPMGRQMAAAARKSGIPYVVAEINALTVREERAKGEPIFFGDAQNEGVLDYACVGTARVVAVTIPNPGAARQVTALARKMNPDCAIITRTRYFGEVIPLHTLGANEVVSEEFEATVEVLIKMLTHYSLTPAQIREIVAEAREEGYAMLGDLPDWVPAPRDLGVEESGAAVDTLRVGEGAAMAGMTLAETDLRRKHGVTVLAVRRGEQVIAAPDGETAILPGDVCVVIGPEEKIAAIDHLFRERKER